MNILNLVMNAIIEALNISWKGVLATVVVIGLVIAVTLLLRLLFKNQPKSKK